MSKKDLFSGYVELGSIIKNKTNKDALMNVIEFRESYEIAKNFQ